MFVSCNDVYWCILMYFGAEPVYSGALPVQNLFDFVHRFSLVLTGAPSPSSKSLTCPINPLKINLLPHGEGSRELVQVCWKFLYRLQKLGYIK